MSKRCKLFVPIITLVLIIVTAHKGQGQSGSTKENYTKATNNAEILVLGTPHLSQIKESFKPELMDSLLSLLTQFGPDAIGVEALSGEQIAARIQKMLAQHPSGKILVIIGASHKAFLDAYLDLMLGVEIVQLSDLMTQF